MHPRSPVTAPVYPFGWLRYAPFWTPAAFAGAVLTLVLVPYVSLIVFLVAVLGAAAAVVALAAAALAGPLLLTRSIRRHGRGRIAAAHVNAAARLGERA